MRLRLPVLVSVLFGLLHAASPTLAHTGFGGGAVETRFVLPIWVVWAAGALVVAVSFAIVGGFLSQGERSAASYTGRRRAVLAVAHETRAGAQPRMMPGRVIGLAVLVAILLVALRPGSDSVLPATALWIVVWGVLPLLAYTVGDLWPRVSPFHALAPMADALRGGRAPRTWPRWLAAWPATVLLVGLIGLEVSDAALVDTPARLALAIVVYTLFTFIGMALFGATKWLEEAEVLTRTLRWWRSASPLAFQDGRLRWRGFAGPLERLPVVRVADVAFTVAVLYGVNFDGFLATRAGASALLHYQDFGVPAPLWTLLVTGYLLFVAAWFAAVSAVRRAAESFHARRDIAARLAASLLPIAVAYHLAHNLFYVVENAPLLLFAALDPLGLHDWPERLVDLPRALVWPSAWTPTLGAVQMLVILTGHVIAVLVAHHLAFRTFPSRIQAVAGELPLTVVMVFYTGIGLWIIGGAAA